MSMLWRGNHLVSESSNIWFFSYSLSLLLELKLLAIKEAANSAVKIPRIISLFKASSVVHNRLIYINKKDDANAPTGLMEPEPAGVFTYIMHVSLDTSELLIWIYNIHSLLSVMDMRSNIFAWILLWEGWIGVNESAGLSCIFKYKLQDLCKQTERGDILDFEIMQMKGGMSGWQMSECIPLNSVHCYATRLEMISQLID